MTIEDEFEPLLSEGLHPHSLSELRALCVEDTRFSQSTTRAELMDRLESVIAKLNDHDIVGEAWIGGSFLTAKLDPEDVDLCLRIPGGILDSGTQRQADCIEWITSDVLYQSQKIDGYLLIEYPATHINYAAGKANFQYWRGHLGKSRMGMQRGIAVVKLERSFQ